ncbi:MULTISPECIES: TlpA disulfide reductase family protein [unclassified Salinibacterium]|uniref:TlpA family protein disulfide reductase n=1 Tax=unclassified Salinibacterium TaxID=2632331 RepID=UPI001424672A|nr:MULTISPECIES: TlpA disulfide reductase family protein [unclassified Salinibacterium]
MTARTTPARRFGARLIVPAIATALVLSGCTSQASHLTDVYESGSGDYISGDGRLISLTADSREAPVDFAGPLDTGEQFSSEDVRGQVVIVNFWYAACPPCRIEAPDLEEIHQTYLDADVTMVGVNVYDSADTALTFARENSVTYPSLIDADTNDVQLAFAGGKLNQNGVPTTLILDKQGRVAARFSGLITSPSVITEIVDELLAEKA